MVNINIESYCEKYPEITDEEKLKNIRNWLDEEGLIQKIEGIKKI